MPALLRAPVVSNGYLVTLRQLVLVGQGLAAIDVRGMRGLLLLDVSRNRLVSLGVIGLWDLRALQVRGGDGGAPCRGLLHRREGRRGVDNSVRLLQVVLDPCVQVLSLGGNPGLDVPDVLASLTGRWSKSSVPELLPERSVAPLESLVSVSFGLQASGRASGSSSPAKASHATEPCPVPLTNWATPCLVVPRLFSHPHTRRLLVFVVCLGLCPSPRIPTSRRPLSRVPCR